MSYLNTVYDGAISSSERNPHGLLFLPEFDTERFSALKYAGSEESAAHLYLDLLKKALTRTAFPDRYKPLKADRMRKKNIAAWAAYRTIRPVLDAMGLVLCRTNYNAAWREVGADWPADAETMVGMKRLENVEFCVKDALARKVPGDFIETGVWRGGVCILIEAILKLYGAMDRRLWLADSFEGLPKPDGRYQQDAGDTFHRFKESLGISLEEVKSNFERYGMLAENVHFLKGWFKDTLPTAPMTEIAVLRLDGDMYASTMDALNSLYAKVSVGGYTIIDDYGAVPTCKQAVDDFRAEHGISEPVQEIDWAGIFWKKEAAS